MADIEKIKERIRKLFNLASNDAAADGEIDNALKAARELMLAHQLSEDDVSAAPEDLRTPEQIADKTEYGSAKSWGSSERVPRWQGILATAVAKFVGTTGVYRAGPALHRVNGIAKNDGEAVCGWVFFGPRDDALLASELHQELLLTCATAAKLKFGGNLLTGPSRDYCDGFASGLHKQIDRAKEEVKSAAIPKLNGKQCTALAIVRAGDIAVAKRTRADKWIEEQLGGKLRSGSGHGRNVGDAGAYSEGKQDGSCQSLSKQRVARIGSR